MSAPEERGPSSTDRSPPSRARRWLSRGLRVGFAALGLLYIGWTVQWTDRVHLTDEATGRELACTVTDGDPLSAAAVTLDCGGEARQSRPSDWSAGPDGERGARFEEGVVTTLRGADVWTLLLGLALVGPTLLLMAGRWMVLLRARGFDVTYGACLRLTFVGYFSNFALPGTVSGDIVRAFYAARGSGRRTEAATSVLVDRVVGLFALVLLACAAGGLVLDDPLGRRVAFGVWGLAAAGTLAALTYFAPPVRRWLARRLPRVGLLGRVDSAAAAYQQHPGALLVAGGISALTHGFLCAGTLLGGVSLGMDADFGLAFVAIPLIYLVGAAPISYQGVGLMEAVAMALLLQPPAVSANHLVGMLLLSRLYRLFYALGGAYLLATTELRLDVASEAPVGAPGPPSSPPRQARDDGAK